MQNDKLNLPEFDFKFKYSGNKKYIFDIIRKKYIILTPEEWVRQNIIKYLNQNLNYPLHLIGIEKQINVFKTVKRPDLIVFGKNLKPLMIVECKKTSIKINKETFKQTINYYLELKSDYFLITNGINHYCCKISDNKCNFLKKIPKYNNL